MSLSPTQLMAVLWALGIMFPYHCWAQSDANWAGVRVIDRDTGRGVPLVELESTHSVRWVSDNTGCVYIDDSELLDRNTFFYVHGHGYDVEPDGFGFKGVRLDIKRGQTVELKVKRNTPAERMVRLTGAGQLRDARLLGHEHSSFHGPLNGEVVGQDSIQAVPWNGKVLCIWGDTSKAGYPLGLFRAAGAYAPLTNTSNAPFDPSNGIPYEYFVEQNFARAMMPLPERKDGVVWLDGLTKVKDAQLQEHVVAHYSRRAGLAEELEHGIARLDPDTLEFKVLAQIPSLDEFRHPYGHAQIVQVDGVEWAVFGNPFPNLRVPATLTAIQDPEQFEALTPLDPTTKAVTQWGWKKSAQRFSSMDESQLIDPPTVPARELRFSPLRTDQPNERIIFHNGSFAWNNYRQKWIVLGGRYNGQDSMLGEVWYAESSQLEGPYDKSIKVATHLQQSFYNVCHHPFWDQKKGQVIFFEGTFTADFSGNPYKTPRYNYNQILYRLDLEKLFAD